MEQVGSEAWQASLPSERCPRGDLDPRPDSARWRGPSRTSAWGACRNPPFGRHGSNYLHAGVVMPSVSTLSLRYLDLRNAALPRVWTLDPNSNAKIGARTPRPRPPPSLRGPWSSGCSNFVGRHPPEKTGGGTSYQAHDTEDVPVCRPASVAEDKAEHAEKHRAITNYMCALALQCKRQSVAALPSTFVNIVRYSCFEGPTTREFRGGRKRKQCEESVEVWVATTLPVFMPHLVEIWLSSVEPGPNLVGSNPSSVELGLALIKSSPSNSCRHPPNASNFGRSHI